MRRSCSLAFLFVALVLTGCGFNAKDAPPIDNGASISGSVHGGQQPISGAHVYLFAASTAGYGQSSVSLLSTLLLPSDTTGAYVTTDANGNFSITADYLCTANTQVYAYVKGGNPGAGTNSSTGLLAALGACPTGGTFAPTLPFLEINEVTTVAAAYALAGFATDATHIASSSTTLAQTGLANAFLNAANLANITNGSAVLTTAAGNGTAPQARVNTLANILAACVNSNPSTSSNCSTLLSNAQASGVTPTDTATAMINIAHNPGANITALYGLVSASAQFGPALTAQPADFTLPITYTGARYSTLPTGPYTGQGGLPGELAVDGGGNIFGLGGTSGNNINKFSPQGADMSSSSTFLSPGSSFASGVAIDTGNNVWVFDGSSSGNSLGEYSNSGTLLSGSGYTAPAFSTVSSVAGLAFDPSGNIVAAVNSTFVRFTSSGVLNPPAVAYPNYYEVYSLAFDPSGDLWFADTVALKELLPTGAAAPGTAGAGITAGHFSQALAIDQNNDQWVSINNGVGVYSSTGQAVLPSGIAVPGSGSVFSIALDGSGTAFAWNANTNGNYQLLRIVTSGSTLSSLSVYGIGFLNSIADNIVVDGSGDVWLSDFLEGNTFTNARLIQYVGLATPVVTPLAAGVADGTLATRP